MKHILVTGGAGFIGSHLCRSLLEKGEHVLCLDNLSSGSEKNIEPLMGHRNFEFIQHDITIPFDFQVDQIYNLACPASPFFYGQYPVETAKACSIGVLNVLELALRCNAKVLQASTSEIYGDPLVHPQVESYRGNVNPIGPRSCYDEGKRFAETLFFDYHRKLGLPVKVVRIFNTYGPHMQPDDGRVISNFIIQSLRGENITVYGDGSQTRSFCFISDLITGLVETMNLSQEITGPVNLGNPAEISMMILAQKIIELTQSSSKIVFQDLPQDDPHKRQPDLSLANQLIGWSPSVHLDSGLKKTLDYFTRILNNI